MRFVDGLQDASSKNLIIYIFILVSFNQIDLEITIIIKSNEKFMITCTIIEQVTYLQKLR